MPLAQVRNLILIKLGGGLITDKNRPFTARPKVIKRLCREIHETRKIRGNLRLIVGHGGGSYPHVPARRFRTAEGIINSQSLKGIAEVQNAAAKLNRIVIRNLIDVKENAVSIQPSACCLTKDGEIQEFYFGSLRRLLDLNVLPVVYGDVALDIKKGCSILSTETILAYLAEKLGGRKFILCGITDGVLDENGKTIPKITPANFSEIKKHLGASNGIDVTGGMLHKVEEVVKLAQKGVVSVIINGNKPSFLKNALLGQKVTGTVICPK